MQFDHEKLDVYRVSLDFAGWVFQLCGKLTGLNRHARDQILRASQSIPLNIAEGNGKRSPADRRRFLEFALRIRSRMHRDTRCFGCLPDHY